MLSATGGLAREANTFYKRLSSMLASKWDHTYSSILRWLRSRLVFSLLRSSIQAIRGARSSRGHAIKMPLVADLINLESHLSSPQTPLLIFKYIFFRFTVICVCIIDSSSKNIYIYFFRGLDARGGRKLRTDTHTQTHIYSTHTGQLQ